MMIDEMYCFVYKIYPLASTNDLLYIYSSKTDNSSIYFQLLMKAAILVTSYIHSKFLFKHLY